MADSLDPPIDKEVIDINVSNNNKIDSNRQNLLSLIDKVIFQKWHTEITLVINKEFSLTDIALIDSYINMNSIQERLIPSKYYGKSSERLIQANEEKLINYKLLNVYICNKGICSEVIKNLSFKVILRNSFMVLTYPFLETYRGIKTNVPFKLISPLIPTEIDSLNNVTILKDTNKERIYRTERSLSSLKTEISLDDQLTENDKKKFKQDKETKICSYSPIAFLHKHRHIVQTPCEKEFGGKDKDIKDGTMLIISFSQYAWTDSLIDIPIKVVINNILILFTIISNTHMIDVLIKEALTDSPLLIIKENINCGNFLNKDKFNFFTGKVNHKPLTDFRQIITVVDERLYGEALFHIFSLNEIYSNIYMSRIMVDFEIFLNSTHFDKLHHGYFNTTTTQQEHKGVQRKVCFIIYTLNFKNDFLIRHFKEIS